MNNRAICPHCLQAGIFVGGRTYYSRGWPAQCRECGTLAYDQLHIPKTLGWIVPEFFLVGALGYYFPTLIRVLMLSLIPLAIIQWWRQKKHPEQPALPRFYRISPQSSRRARLFTYLMLSAAFIAIVALFVPR